MKYLLILLIFGLSSCQSTRPTGDFLPLEKSYATRHEHNFQIWLKNQNSVLGLTAFKNPLNCPDECEW